MTDTPLSGTKQEILLLLMRQELSAAALAGQLSVSGAAIRQHLQTLEAVGLVERRKEAHQPGRPAFLYRLSDDGKRRFRQRHDLLLDLILETLLRRQGPAGLESILTEAAASLAAESPARATADGAPARWCEVMEWLESLLAWNADAIEEPGGRSRIVIHQCPFQGVSQANPNVCGTFFPALLRGLFGDIRVTAAADVEKPACCSLIVQHPSA